MLKRAFVVIISVIVASCAPPRDKQHYALKDSNGRTYANGDYLRYQFTRSSVDGGSNYTGDWTIKWKSVSFALPNQAPAAIPRELMAVTSAFTPLGNAQASYATIYFIEQMAGNLKLFGVQQEGQITPFLVQNADGSYGVPLYISPFALNIRQSYGFTLYPCSPTSCENTVKDNSSYSRFSVIAIDTVDTPFGTFEAYWVDFKQALQANYSENQSLKSAFFHPLMQGNVWIYPPLGVVKARMSYTDTTSAVLYNYSIELVETNIEISP